MTGSGGSGSRAPGGGGPGGPIPYGGGGGVATRDTGPYIYIYILKKNTYIIACKQRNHKTKQKKKKNAGLLLVCLSFGDSQWRTGFSLGFLQKTPKGGTRAVGTGVHFRQTSPTDSPMFTRGDSQKYQWYQRQCSTTTLPPQTRITARLSYRTYILWFVYL